MKVAIDTYVDGSKPAGDTLPAAQLTEVQAIDGTCWAHVAIPEGKTTTATIQRAEDALPEPVQIRLNPSWIGPVVDVGAAAAVSARAGWPRLQLELVDLPVEDAPQA